LFPQLLAFSLSISFNNKIYPFMVRQPFDELRTALTVNGTNLTVRPEPFDLAQDEPVEG
jgi:hypothetical protein